VPALLIVLVCAAVYRATRLIVADDIALPLRMWVMDRFGEDGKMAYLVECPWCMSIWVGAAGVAGLTVAADVLGWVDHGVPYPLAVWLAASAFTGVVSEVLGLFSRADDVLEEETHG
jgi:hypothetical protein